MSAAASGFELSYRVLLPTEADLTGLRKGARAFQKGAICWHPSQPFENWVIKKVNEDTIEIMPLRARWTKGTRIVPRQFFDKDYRIRTKKVC